MKLQKGEWKGKAKITEVGQVPWDWSFTNWLTKIGVYRKNIEYSFENDQEDPLIYIDKNGVWHKPQSIFYFDLGSVPPIFDWFVGRDSYPKSFGKHDSDYGFKTEYISYDKGITWESKSVIRLDADYNLGCGVLSENGARIQAQTIYTAVSRFGGLVWNSKKNKNNRVRSFSKSSIKYTNCKCKNI